MNSVLYFKGNWENKNKKTSSSVFLIFLELQTRAFLANRISKILITKHFISARQYIDPLLALLLSSILALIFFVNQFRFLIGYWTGSLGVCVSVCVQSEYILSIFTNPKTYVLFAVFDIKKFDIKKGDELERFGKKISHNCL